jgi:hypothetical protein
LRQSLVVWGPFALGLLILAALTLFAGALGQ